MNVVATTTRNKLHLTAGRATLIGTVGSAVGAELSDGLGRGLQANGNLLILMVDAGVVDAVQMPAVVFGRETSEADLVLCSRAGVDDARNECDETYINCGR